MSVSPSHSLPAIPAEGRGRELVLSSGTPGHGVQFYESEEFLAAAVGEFLAEGLTIGQSLVVIATEPRREAFAKHLVAEGFDLERARRDGQLTLLDARETLSSFMIGATPDPERFRAAIGPVLDQCSRRVGHTALRLYGEMVDVLWKDGNTEGAIRLEELWNDLSSHYAFSLLCAYAMGNFYRAADAERFRQVCGQHTHVIPTERYTRATEEQRLIEITLLQQRAHSLEAEIEERKDLERRLRGALTARRRAEEAARASECELRAALADRERLLEAERAARADAQRADRAKGQFLAMMSHELRTPLNAIGGHVQLVEMGVHGPLTDAQREALRRVERSQRHLLALINDVLNLTRIETGRVEYLLESVPIAPLLGEIMSTLEPLLAARRLGCALSVPDRALAAYADREKAHQIVLNLLTNAIKFTAEEGRITIEASLAAGSPAAVSVRVSDTGVGIPAGQLERVFEPFVQLGGRPAASQDGVGLGLAISRDLARGMGGDLTATSRVGVGSTFTLTLPAAERN